MDTLHKALLASASDQMMVIDPHGRVEAVNGQMCERLGAAEQDLLHASLYDLFPPEAAARRRRIVANAVSTGRAIHFEDVSESGRSFDICITPVPDGDGAVSHLVVRTRDISTALQAEEDRYRLALAIEQAVEAVLLLDDELCIQYANQAFEEMTGFALQEIKGRPMAMLYRSREQQEVLAHAMRCLIHSESWLGQTEAATKDGAVFRCEQTFVRIRGKRFKSLGYVSIWRDMTEMCELEKQLRRAQKMEAVGALAGGLAHDFNNILGPIMLHAEMGVESLQEDDPYRQSFAEILGAAERARDLVEQILGLSRKREGDKATRFRLRSIIKECLKLLRPSVPSDIAVTFERRTDEDMIQADPTQVHQVFMNLATNGLQAMESKGGGGGLAVIIDAGAPKTETVLAGDEGAPVRFVRLDVCDTGVGIEPSSMPMLFDPFFTTKKGDRGTGLGLAVVHTVVTALGGVVEVSSSPGEGACFSVFLPVCGVGAGDDHGPAGETPQKTAVLLVDDDPVTSPGSRQALEDLGCRVTFCRNGFEALAVFRKEPETFDVCIVEALQDEMSGFELTRELLLHRQDVPVVLCSTATHGSLEADARQLGAVDFVRKPFRMDELRAALHSACGHRPPGKRG